jgi:hypothetical protein
MDVTANTATNEAAREKLQNEISAMTANNYRYMKSAINEYSRNHIKDGARAIYKDLQEVGSDDDDGPLF